LEGRHLLLLWVKHRAAVGEASAVNAEMQAWSVYVTIAAHPPGHPPTSVFNAGQAGDGAVAEVVLFLKTEPRLEVNPGERVCVRQPWQAMDVGGARVLLVKHACVVDLDAYD